MVPVLGEPELFTSDRAKTETEMKMLFFLGVSQAVPTYTTTYEAGRTMIVQFGMPRTESNMQFRIATHMATLKNRQRGLDPPQTMFSNGLQDMGPNRVLKSHIDLKSITGRLKHTDLEVMLLMTTTGNTTVVDPRIAYVQHLETINTSPAIVIPNYAKLFGLTPEEAELTRAHIKFWYTYRLCCGAQQSIQNRLRLHGCPALWRWSDPMDPHCERYNLTAVEELMIISSHARASSYDDPITLEEALLPGENETFGAGVKLGDCQRDQDGIIHGRLLDASFIDCPSLVKRSASPTEYHDYLCRNFPNEARHHHLMCDPIPGGPAPF